MLKKNRRESEVRLYWRTMQDGIANVTLADYQDELDTLARFTDSPVLREMCRKSIHRFDHLGSFAKVANGQ
jgi:hypothetical protein